MSGQVKATGRLVAHKLPRKPETPESLELGVSDNANNWNDRLVTHRPERPNEAIRIADSQERSVANDSFEGGKVTFSLKGRSPQGESGTVAACQVLIERLNQDGASWVLRPPSREEGVDCEAYDDKEILRIQVTRAQGSTEFWKALSQSSRINGELNVDKLVDGLRAAITHKKRQASEDVILALDAVNTPRYAFADTVETFRRRYGSWAREQGYKEIWVVGPTARMTAQLA